MSRWSMIFSVCQLTKFPQNDNFRFQQDGSKINEWFFLEIAIISKIGDFQLAAAITRLKQHATYFCGGIEKVKPTDKNHLEMKKT